MSITLEVAKTQRLSLVPLKPAEKRPFENDWQLTPPIIEHEDAAGAWAHATSTGEAGIVARMSGLLAFESDTPQRERQLRAFLNLGGLVPCYVEKRPGAEYKCHVYVREPHVLDPEEDCGFYFDEGGLTAKVTAQMRCCLGPESDYQTTLERWNAPRATAEGYARLVHAAGEIEETQARELRDATGSAANAASRHTTVFRLGCLLYRFTAEEERVLCASWLWQRSKFGSDALASRREVERQLKGSRRKVQRSDGHLAAERRRRNTTRRGIDDARRHLSACLYSTWTDDADLISEVVGEVFHGE